MPCILSGNNTVKKYSAFFNAQNFIFLSAIKFFLLGTFFWFAPVLDAQNLTSPPDIGDPTAAVLPLSREQQLGAIFTMNLRAILPLVEDIELNEYISALGNELTNVAPTAGLPFYFLLSRSDAVNAFATIGGVITLNSGLILLTKNESQLASVFAHEIGHISSRHIARSLFVQKDLAWVNTLAILATIIASTYNPKLGQLGLQALSIPIEEQLAYSRHFEFEADQIAIKIMTAANIDPIGMSQFFSLLNELHSPGGPPAFLRSHPLTNERITSATNYARKRNPAHRNNTWEFQFAQARLYALVNPSNAVKTKDNNLLALYQKAIALTRLLKPQQAVQILQKIPSMKNHLPVQLALAQAQIQAGRYSVGEKILKQLGAFYPQRESIHYYLAIAQMHQNKLKQAYQTLRPFANSFRYPVIDKQLSKILTKDGQIARGYESISDYYLNTGRVEEALKYLDLAKKQAPQERIFLARIENKRARVEQIEKEMKNPLP